MELYDVRKLHIVLRILRADVESIYVSTKLWVQRVVAKQREEDHLGQRKQPCLPVARQSDWTLVSITES